MAGYDESDIIQNYAGWVMFRNSDWSFPLGTASNMAVGDGTVISFTDSIPYMAIFFKIFRKWLPETFQYLGLYSLLCYILQAVSSGKLLFYKTKDYFYTFAGTVLFCFSPILLDRAFRHTALGSHWIVIFAIMFYMKHKDNYNFKYYVYFLILEMLSVGIHPYFLPMAAIFSLMCVITDLRRNKFYPVFYFLAQLVITYFTGCIIGVLGNKIEISRFGYGYFSMNINAVVNPTSCGGYTWSNFIKIKPQILGNYDGFNYIGFGMLISVLILILLIIIFNSWKSLKELIKKEWLVLIICFFLVLFSVSNVVTYNDKELFTIQLPEFLLKLCGIFRASSRLFYPVYYLFFLFIFVSLWQYRIHLEKNRYIRL